MPFWTTAAILGGTALAGSAIAAHSTGKAANAQVDAANHAADLQHQDAQAALAFQKQQYATDQKNLAPWLSAGTGAINSLSGMLKNGEFKDWTGSFSAPTMTDAQNDPGYEFGLTQGTKAIERSAAARGGVLSGGTAKAEGQFANDYATTKYGDVYNRAYNEYATKYNEFNNNQTNKFNRFASIAGVGQQAANNLGTLGQAASGNISNILLTSGQQIGNDYLRAGDARASGYINSGNIWSSGINDLGSLALLKQLYGKSSSPGSYPAGA